jgi:hypothetical protein
MSVGFNANIYYNVPVINLLIPRRTTLSFDQSQSLVQIHVLEVVAYPKYLPLRIVKAASIGAGYRLGEDAPIDQRLVVFRTRTYILGRIIRTTTKVNKQT